MWDFNDNGGAFTGSGTFSNCIFKNNSVGNFNYGGAVYGNGTFLNCTFENNSAPRGGAVAGDGFFTNCTFTGNSANNIGGAFSSFDDYGPGKSVFSNCTFENNSANKGGAVSGERSFVNCIFKNNSAMENGGAIAGGGYIDACVFINNSAKDGGAIFGGGTFSNCIFTTNSATENGGAVNGSANFINSTFYGNKANEQGGAVSEGGKIINSIFYKNTAAEKDNDLNNILDIDFSLFNFMSGVANVGANNIMGDPKFIDPDNGDFHLHPDSPCINKGKLFDLKDAKNLNVKPSIVGKGINMGADDATLASVLGNYQRNLKNTPDKSEPMKSETQKAEDEASVKEDTVTTQAVEPTDNADDNRSKQDDKAVKADDEKCLQSLRGDGWTLVWCSFQQLEQGCTREEKEDGMTNLMFMKNTSELIFPGDGTVELPLSYSKHIGTDVAKIVGTPKGINLNDIQWECRFADGHSTKMRVTYQGGSNFRDYFDGFSCDSENAPDYARSHYARLVRSK